jgi:hypothetical protein
LQVELAEAPTAAEYVPVPQAVHDASEVCPVAFPYLPSPQSTQAVSPTAFVSNDENEYLPATHTVHGPPIWPIYPALQVQLVKAVLPAGELEFDGQE